MTSAKFIFCLMCLQKLAQVAAKEVFPSSNRKTSVISVKAGQNLTLTCFYNDAVSTEIYWFKQSLGEKPALLCSYFISTQNFLFFNNFKNNPRFQVHLDDKLANLTIADVEFSDSALYLCAKQYSYIYEFIQGYDVIVEASELTVNQLASESIKSGGSMTLNCSVHTGTCDEDHTVYWFRNSGRSQMELVYSQKGRNNQCEKKTNTCVYSLFVKNVKISRTAIYYCAVAACGRIAFGGGNGTRLQFEGNLVWVYSLSAAWILTIILVFLLSIFIFMAKRRNNHQSLDTDSQSRFAAASTANTEGHQEEDNLHYAALKVNRFNRSTAQRIGQNECVYSGVRQ
uniref:Ig-like domain-containing protein n=1 Tax=Tetraodon nigroviridis TaxID=99883 RepID=H3BVP4_TETNG